MFKHKGRGPSDFCMVDSKPETRLSAFERLTLTGGSELERALAWFMKQVAGFAYSPHIGDLSVHDAFEASKFYADSRWASPESFFIQPTALPVFSAHIIHGLEDGEILDLSFESQYEVQNPKFKIEFDSQPENKIVHARYWRHHSGALGTVIALHGWTMGDQRTNSLALLPGVFYRAGLDVALIELPYHGRRRPAGSGKTDFFPSSHLIKTNEGMGQAVSDLRCLAWYLRAQGSKFVGAVGMSLGAYIASLWASLDPLEFCVPIVPLASMAELAWEILTRDPVFEGLKKEGLTLELLKSIYRIHSPLSYQLRIPKERVMIIAGIGDEIISPRHPKMLWDHWGRPTIHWIGGGHFTHMKRAKAFEEVLRFLRSLGAARKV